MIKPVSIGPGRIIFSPGQIRLIPDARFIVNRFIMEGFTIGQHKATRSWVCNCSAFQQMEGLEQKRDCAHLRRLRIPGGGEPYETRVEIAEGLRLRVIKQRQKVHNERKATK